MGEVTINYLAVVVAAIAVMITGALWFAPFAFGKHWLELLGKKPEELNNKAKAYGVATISSLIMVYILAYAIHFVGADTLALGAQTGFWVWLGFVATTGAINQAFEHRSMPLFWLNSAYHLVSLIIAGMILAVW